ncbi:MAG TPA: YceI family protein [Chryseosolibacter sp.]|nr:YceI family protein [Chryseosolibacter sp.]
MSKQLRILFFLVLMLSALPGRSQDNIFQVTAGTIHFKSDAPLELIEASSNDLKGLINFTSGSFAFSVSVNSFQGFNSSLQREHFNENYMESEKFPKATFTGKIIETVDLATEGDVTIRAKGKLNIHGIEQERIIRSTINVKGNKLTIKSTFTVLLQEHNITIPKVVQQKIAEEIYVTIDATAEKK